MIKKLGDRAQAIKDGKTSAEIERAEARAWLADDTPEHVDYEGWTPEELGYPMESEKAPDPEMAEADDLDLNSYLSAKVMIPKDGVSFASGKVVARARDSEGVLIGKSNPNPLFDTSVYEVKFDDGSVERYNANIIAEHIYSQVDGEGYGMTILDEIIDHKWDDSAILGEDEGFRNGPDGTRIPIETTKGWWLLAKLKDHTERWFKLKVLKESNPLEVAQYAVDNQLVDEPAFRWWVPHTIKKRNRILKAMQKRYFRTHQKFGIEVPKTVKRCDSSSAGY